MKPSPLQAACSGELWPNNKTIDTAKKLLKRYLRWLETGPNMRL